jgi:predicted Zn-dependent peptidase
MIVQAILLLHAVSASAAQNGTPPAASTHPSPAIGRPTSAQKYGEPQVRRLANGFRYMVLPRKSLAAGDASHVNFRLHVTGGWLAEGQGERGLVHLLEHVETEGSSEFTADDLIKLRDGLTVANEWGAWTSPETTNYYLSSRTNDIATIDRLLHFLGGIPSGLHFDKAAVDRQRQIVMNEMTLRRPQDTTQYARDHVLAPGSALDLSQGYISTDVPTATLETIERLYHRVYRPENMILTVVGDVDPAVIDKLVAKYFGYYEDRTGSPLTPVTVSSPLLIKERRQPVSFSRSPIGPPAVLVSFASDSNSTIRDVDHKLDRTIVDRALALIMSQRLGVEAIAAGLNAPTFTINDDGHNPRTVQLIGAVDGVDGQTVLRFLIRQVANTNVHGFSDLDVARAKRTLLRQLADEHNWKAYASNYQTAERIGFEVANGTPSRSTDAAYEQDVRAVTALSSERLNSAWAAIVKIAPMQVRVESAGLAGLDDPAKSIDAISGGTKKIEAQLRKAPAPVPVDKLAYQAGPSAIIKSDVGLPEGVRRITFQNGFVLNLVKRLHNGMWLEIAAEIEGREARNRLTYCDAVAAPMFLNAGGSTRQSAAEMQEAVTGSDIRFAPISVSGSGLSTHISARKEDVETAILFLYASLFDPGFRSSGHPAAQARLSSQLAHRYDDPAWALVGTIEERLAALRTGVDAPFDAACVQQASMSQAKKMLEPILLTGKPELAIAGNFDEERIIQLVGSTFGNLAEPKNPRSEPSVVPTLPKITVGTPKPNAGQTVGGALWILGGTPTAHDRAVQEMFSVAFSRLLYAKLIEQNQLGYALKAQRIELGEWSAEPAFFAALAVAVGRTAVMDAAIVEVAKQMTETPLPADVLETARHVALDGVVGSYNEDRVWAYQAAQLGRRPDAVKLWRDLEREFPLVTSEDILAYAKHVLAEQVLTIKASY